MHRFRSVVFLWVLPEKTTQWNSVYLQIGFLHVNRFKPCKMLRFPRWGDPGGTGFAEHRGVRRFLLWSTRKIKQIIDLYIDDLWSIYNASTTNTLFTYFLFFSYACPGGSGLPLLYLDGGASLGAILCITRVFNLSSRHWNQRNCVLCPLRPKSSQEPRSTAMFIQVSNWFSFPKNWATDWYVFFSKSSHEMCHFLNAACLEAVVWTDPVGWTLSAVRHAAIRRPSAVAPWGDKPGTAPHNTRHATPARARADWEKPQKLKVWTGT